MLILPILNYDALAGPGKVQAISRIYKYFFSLKPTNKVEIARTGSIICFKGKRPIKVVNVIW